MRKQMIKKLYTTYTVEGELDDIRNDPNHIFSSYSGGKAECIKYHDTLTSWFDELTRNDFKIGFGLKTLTEDGKKQVTTHVYNLWCSTYLCNTSPKEVILRSLATIIQYYLNSDPCYYEIEMDYIHMSKELTGHMYYKSPHESYDDCGTCDGAKCATCRERFIVEDLNSGEVYYNGLYIKEAERIKEEVSKDYSDIISDMLIHCKIDMNWFEKKIAGRSDIKALMNILTWNGIPYVTTN